MASGLRGLAQENGGGRGDNYTMSIDVVKLGGVEYNSRPEFVGLYDASPFVMLENIKRQYNKKPHENHVYNQLLVLAKSIQINGQQDPVQAYKNGDFAEVVHGWHRTLSVTLLNVEGVPTDLFIQPFQHKSRDKFQMGKDRILSQLIGNSGKNNSPLTEAVIYRDLTNKYGYTTEQIINEGLTTKGKQTVDKYIRVASLDEDILNRVIVLFQETGVEPSITALEELIDLPVPDALEQLEQGVKNFINSSSKAKSIPPKFFSEEYEETKTDNSDEVKPQNEKKQKLKSLKAKMTKMLQDANVSFIEGGFVSFIFAIDELEEYGLPKPADD